MVAAGDLKSSDESHVGSSPTFPTSLKKVIMYIVMRSPCLMEDEGRHFFVDVFPTKEEAQAWINNQEGEYFGPGNYYIASKPWLS